MSDSFKRTFDALREKMELDVQIIINEFIKEHEKLTLQNNQLISENNSLRECVIRLSKQNESNIGNPTID